MKKQNVQKKHIVNKIAREKKLRSCHVLDIVNAFLKKVVDSLSKGERLEFRDFGVFEVVRRKARLGRNPMSPAIAIKIPPRNSVKFIPGNRMKKAVM